MDESKKRQMVNGIAGDIWDCYFLEYSGRLIDELLAKVNENYLLTKEELEKLQGIDLSLYLKREDIQEEIFDRVQIWLTQYAKTDYVDENLEDIRKDVDDFMDAMAIEFSNVYDIVYGMNNILDNVEEFMGNTEIELDALTTRTETTDITLNAVKEEAEKIPSILSEIEQLKTAIEDLQKLPPSQDILPVYKEPTIKLNSNKTVIELGNPTQIILTPVFTKNDAGNIKGVKIYKNGTEISSEYDTRQITIDGVDETTTFKLEISYAAGPIKNTTTGVPYPDTSIKEGTKEYVLEVTAVSASYYGVGTADTKLIKKTKSFTWKNITCIDDRLIYKYPKVFGKLTSIKDANNFEYINSYTYSEEDINNVTYSVYTLTDAMTVENAMQIYS